MDVRNLGIPDASIDVAIDKGTLDAMIHGSPLDPPDDVQRNMGSYVGEVSTSFLREGFEFCVGTFLPLVLTYACLQWGGSCYFSYCSESVANFETEKLRRYSAFSNQEVYGCVSHMSDHI